MLVLDDKSNFISKLKLKKQFLVLKNPFQNFDWKKKRKRE
jgi:hypothetical protein